ncbi:MAG: transposase [Rhodocyclaceae bacterium]|nr:transposase [Rhodocyclaceae bacterium]
MARPLRIELSGGLYHVTSRGDRREAIFLCDADREAWLALLGQVCERFNWRCHAYCQMTNHYHLVIETPQGNLAQGMRQMNGVYTQYVNRSHGRVGHVFQGRYKAILVEKDRYLLELARYVVLNPLRAGMVRELGEWPWSSYPAMIGKTGAPAWLQTDWLLGQFGAVRRRAQDRFEDFVRAGVGLPALWDKLSHQIFLGDDEFVSHMQDRIAPGQTLNEVPRIQRRRPAKPLATFRLAHEDDPRSGMALAYLSGGYAMKEVAVEFGVHYTTVSRAVKAHAAKLASGRAAAD